GGDAGPKRDHALTVARRARNAIMFPHAPGGSPCDPAVLANGASVITRGVLLAGGEGERLGAGPIKALAIVGGITLLARAIAVLERVSDEIVIAAPAEVEPALPSTTVPCRRVDDRAPGGCPLAGAVAAWEGPCERAVVLGVDFPLMRPEALAALAERMD